MNLFHLPRQRGGKMVKKKEKTYREKIEDAVIKAVEKNVGLTTPEIVHVLENAERKLLAKRGYKKVWKVNWKVV